jgi:hypothetical protein
VDETLEVAYDAWCLFVTDWSDWGIADEKRDAKLGIHCVDHIPFRRSRLSVSIIFYECPSRVRTGRASCRNLDFDSVAINGYCPWCRVEQLGIAKCVILLPRAESRRA